jgi:hypothetical protein
VIIVAKLIRFTDILNAFPIKVSDEVKDYYANMPASGVRPLQVKFAATHAGKVTRNNGFYLPHEMRAGVPSWTDQYQKPILLHHEDHEDAIGRVVAARYVDISTGIRNSYEKRGVSDGARVSDKVIAALVAGTLPNQTVVDVVTRYFINDNQLIEDPDFEGLGYIELTAAITDPDAIQKFLDGRYLTGSVGATTTKALCSVCRKDWATDELCEHRPGKSYEGKLCVLIAGKLKYLEYSVVNRPADTHSRAIEISANGVQDFAQLDVPAQYAILTNNIPSVTYSVSLADSLEEGTMAVEEKDEATTPEVKPEVVVEPKVEPVVSPVVDAVVEPAVVPAVDPVLPVADVIVVEELTVPSVEPVMEPEVKQDQSDVIQLVMDLRKDIDFLKASHTEHQTLLDEVVSLRAQVAKEPDNTKLIATQTELKSALDELKQVQDQFADLLTSLRKGKEERICLLKSLVEKDFSREGTLVSLADKSLEDVEKMLVDVEKGFDLNKVRDMITKDTAETKPLVTIVEDPTHQVDNTVVTQVVDEKQREAVMRKFLDLRKVNPQAADKFMAEMRRRNLIKG